MKRILLALLAGSSVFSMNTYAQHIDYTFNTNGYLPYLGPNSNSEGNLGSANASAIQADGKIVTVLERDPNSPDLSMHIYRYLSNGPPVTIQKHGNRSEWRGLRIIDLRYLGPDHYFL
ncbi:hypothetical protein [Fluviicola sp.]|uniref:hypothetical protein n=1 Tax=Fluviicola sp. TaxID=1917219 RepID=UPI003D2ABD42